MENKNFSESVKEIDKACSKVKSFIESLVDENSFVETDVFLTGKGFDSAFDALGEGVVTGYATISGRPIHLFAQNADVLKGSMSKAHAEKIHKAMQRAIKAQTPFLSIVDSCGARVGEGASIMEGYANLVASGVELSSEVPHFCIVKGNAVGMMATYVAGADFTFMAKDAIMSVNAPMCLVADEKSFPVDYTKKLGFDCYKNSTDVANFVYGDTKDLKGKLTSLCDMILADEAEEATDDANRVDPTLENAKASDMVASICDKKSVVEFCPDFGADVKCSLAKINGITVGVVANNAEYMSEQGMEKICSFVNKLDSFDLPLVTLVDTLGVKTDLQKEYNGIAKKTYAFMKEIKNATMPKIGIAVGNAVGFGYSALMSKSIGFDYTLATTNSMISPISSTTAVVGMMADQLAKSKNVEEMKEKLENQYANIQASPMVAAKDGYIDNVIEATNLRPYIASALLMLLGI